MKRLLLAILLTISVSSCVDNTVPIHASKMSKGRFTILESFYLFDSPSRIPAVIIQDRTTNACFILMSNLSLHGRGLAPFPCP